MSNNGVFILSASNQAIPPTVPAIRSLCASLPIASMHSRMPVRHFGTQKKSLYESKAGDAGHRASLTGHTFQRKGRTKTSSSYGITFLFIAIIGLLVLLFEEQKKRKRPAVGMGPCGVCCSASSALLCEVLFAFFFYADRTPNPPHDPTATDSTVEAQDASAGHEHPQLQQAEVNQAQQGYIPTLSINHEVQALRGGRKEWDAFICHTGKGPDLNKHTAVCLAVFLRVLGFDVWLDVTHIPDGDYQEHSITNGLLGSRVVVTVLNDDFFRASWPQREAAFALTHGLPVIPIFHTTDPASIAEQGGLLPNGTPLGSALRMVAGPRSEAYRDMVMFFNAVARDLRHQIACHDPKRAQEITVWRGDRRSSALLREIHEIFSDYSYDSMSLDQAVDHLRNRFASAGLPGRGGRHPS